MYEDELLDAEPGAAGVDEDTELDDDLDEDLDDDDLGAALEDEEE